MAALSDINQQTIKISMLLVKLSGLERLGQSSSNVSRSSTLMLYWLSIDLRPLDTALLNNQLLTKSDVFKNNIPFALGYEP